MRIVHVRCSPMGAWLRLTGTHPSYIPADLAIVTTDPELDIVETDTVPARLVVQTGAMVTRGKSVDPRPIADILVSFSTISYPGQIGTLQRTLDALGTLPLTALATITPALKSKTLRIPDNVTAVGFMPHAELLPRVRMLIGHGGHGTTMSALAHGVPVLVLAMSKHADQPLVGRAVERTGVGIGLQRDASVASIRAAIEKLAGDRGYSDRAQRLAQTFNERDSAAIAADAIASIAKRDLA